VGAGKSREKWLRAREVAKRVENRKQVKAQGSPCARRSSFDERAGLQPERGGGSGIRLAKAAVEPERGARVKEL
jgi:hypothetical protein